MAGLDIREVINEPSRIQAYLTIAVHSKGLYC